MNQKLKKKRNQILPHQEPPVLPRPLVPLPVLLSYTLCLKRPSQANLKWFRLISIIQCNGDHVTDTNKFHSERLDRTHVSTHLICLQLENISSSDKNQIARTLHKTLHDTENLKRWGEVPLTRKWMKYDWIWNVYSCILFIKLVFLTYTITNIIIYRTYKDIILEYKNN